MSESGGEGESYGMDSDAESAHKSWGGLDVEEGAKKGRTPSNLGDRTSGECH